MLPGCAVLEATASALAVEDPQAELAVTEILAVLKVAGKLMLTVLVPCPLTSTSPAGTVQV